MAWLQGLANKTENLLDKIDKSANSLFNENASPDSGRYTIIPILDEIYVTPESPVSDCMDAQFSEEDFTKDSSLREETSFEWYKTELDIIQNDYENKMMDLQQQNDNLSRQLLNLQHIFTEVSNENENLKNDLHQANESVVSVENEMQEYKKKVQKALHEKDNFVTQEIPYNINENFQKKIEYYEELNNILSQKVQTLTQNSNNLQSEYKLLQNTNELSIRSLQNNLEAERKIRISLENEYQAKNNETKMLSLELNNQIKLIEEKNREYENLKDMKNKSEEKFDLTFRVQSLTDALILKQNTLETISTEKNVLKLQLEKIRNEYHEALKEKQNKDCEYNEPFRKSKSGDSLSARCCIYFSRSKFSRIIVIMYFIILHVWVLVILWYYVPK